MEPPKSAAGQLVAGGLALGASAWLGATLNSRSVAKANPAAASLAAATGAVTGGLLTLFGASALAIGDSKWRRLGATTALLGASSFAALALVSLKASDRLLRGAHAAHEPQALTVSEIDSGSTIQLSVGDTVTVELPASTSDYRWQWSQGPAGVVDGPVMSLGTLEGNPSEHDTFTARTPGTVKLSATLAPTMGTGAPVATWTATAQVSA